jgi:hypothetical protein
MTLFRAKPVILRLTRWLGSFLNQYDRVLLALLSVVIVITGTFWFKQYSKNHNEGPSIGGTFVAGIVGEQNEVEAIAAEITKTGFFHLDSNGALQNTLIESWQANSDQTEFTFVLKKGVDQNLILDDLNNNIELFGAAAFDVDGDNGIKITLKDSNPNLPLLLAQPLFDYGPYKLSKTSGMTSILTRNTNSVAPGSYLNKIIIQRYSDQAELQAALSKKKIDGAYYFDGIKIPSGYSVKEITQSRYYAVILNINQSPFRDETFRKNLLNGQSVAGKSFTLTAPDQEPQKSLANELVVAWENQGAKVQLDVKPLAEVRDTLGPSRNFQAMIIGIDYGAELDPYYIWHSTQVRPPSNNLSGVKNDQIDQTLLQIRANYNVNERRNLIDGLHQLLLSQGVAKILQQESESYVITDGVSTTQPPLPLAVHDLVQDISEWWIK